MALRPAVSVIVPAYNNATTIGELLEQLRGRLEAKGWDYEIIVIDDGSVDATWRIVDEISAADSRVVGLRFSRNFGQHAGIAAGIEASSGGVLVLMDADLEDDPRDLDALVAPIVGGDADIVVSTSAGSAGKRKRPLSRAFHRLFARVVSSDLPADVGTYRAFTADIARALLDYRERGAVYGPLMHQIGYRVEFVRVTHGSDRRARSSYSFRKRWRLATDALLSYSDVPYVAVMWVGAALSIGSIVFLLVLLVQYVFVGTRLVSGIGLLAAMLALSTGVMMLAISAVFAYVIRVFREVLDRPRYHVMQRCGEGLTGARRK